MFQTEPIVFLQSFANPLLTFIMKGMAVTGYTWFLSVVILLVMLGLDFRKGFQVFQIVIWTGIITSIAKDLFALPRPIWVDFNVQDYESGHPNLSPFNGMGARGFFGFLPQNVIDTNRQNGGSFGLPSGHVSSAVALWGGLALAFRGRLIGRIVPALVVLMGISRMYLGKHFLVDVLGGAALGIIVLVVARQLISGNQEGDRKFRLPGAVPYVFYLGLPLLLAIASIAPGELVGSLIGVNVVYLALRKLGFPDETGSVSMRALRVLSGGVLFFAISFLIDRGLSFAGLSTTFEWVSCLKAALIAFIGIGGSVMLFLKLGWYRRRP